MELQEKVSQNNNKYANNSKELRFYEGKKLAKRVNYERNEVQNNAKHNVKVKTDNLSFYYGSKQALYNINIEMPAHQVTALIGPSGCGKTTFLRIINRMNDLIPGSCVKGNMLIDGTNIYNPDIDVVDLRRRVGLVFQQPNPFPKNIYENVAYGPRIHGIRKRAQLDEIVEESLRQAALFDEVKDRLKESGLSLSGGQQQRLCIARVLAVKPEIVLMDEPTSALDPVATQRIEDLIRTLSDKYTITIVTHNMQQAARISDLTAFFLMGELIEWGSASQLFTKPKDTRTEEYITGRFG